MKTVRMIAALAASVWPLLSLSAVRTPAPPPPGDYRIGADGRVDAGTYNGWRVFHSACFGCHGTAGVGTDLAPSLVDRVKSMTPRAFAAKVLTSYRLVPADDDSAAARDALLDEVMKRDRSARGFVVMPAWEGDARVPVHVLDIYAYLNARADGAIGTGRPKPPLITPPKR